jgi:hypothetical protein
MRYNEFRAAKREVKQLTASSRAMQQVYDEAFKATKKASSLTNSLANLNFCTGAGNGLLAIGAAVPWLTGTAAAIGVGTGVGLKLHVRHRAHRAGRMAVLEKAFKNPAQRGALSVEARRYLQRNLIADQNKIVNAYRSTRKEASELRTAVRGNKKLLGHLERSLGQ